MSTILDGQIVSVRGVSRTHAARYERGPIPGSVVLPTFCAAKAHGLVADHFPPEDPAKPACKSCARAINRRSRPPQYAPCPSCGKEMEPFAHTVVTSPEPGVVRSLDFVGHAIRHDPTCHYFGGPA